jgi:DNA-binding NtrC family response regulator
LRVIEERVVQPVGGTQEVPVDVRFLFATHKNLEQLVNEGQFRLDLLHRINIITINIPPLRERVEEIPLIAQNFLASERLYQEVNKPIKGISEDAMAKLLAYSWPGNVRELENVLIRATINADSDIILPDHLPTLTPESLSRQDEYTKRRVEDIYTKLVTGQMRIENLARFKQVEGEHIFVRLIERGLQQWKDLPEVGRRLGLFTDLESAEGHKGYENFRQHYYRSKQNLTGQS